jgi:glycosyltransferase involved in cell wall biosynthesis
MTPRHIMMTTDAIGGVWVYALALSRRLAEAGHRVTLVSLGPPPQGAKRDLASALPPEVDPIVTSLSLEWLDPDGHDAARARSELLHLADRIRPDLVHINGYREGSIGWPCPSVVVAHSCVLSWWQATRGEAPPSPQWSVYADAVRAGLNAADAWVAPTEAFRSTIENLYQPETFGWVIRNGIDSVPQPSTIKDPLILASGRIWDGGKNLAGLAAIAAELPWPLYIAGAGMADAQNQPQSVHWLGEIAHAELQRLMSRASIYAAPAYYEPFGLGILEAARAGCALVLSDIPTLRELWEGAALHVPAGDQQGQLRALTALCSDDRSRQQLQRAAAERARQYSLDHMLTAYLQLYDRVLAPIVQVHPLASGRELGL